MSKEDQEVAKLARLRRLHELRKNYQIFFWKPYDKQKEFHAAGAHYRERLLMAGNQLGKCNTVSSYVDLPDGSRMTYGELHERGAPFRVFAWNGDKPVISVATNAIIKPSEPCVRIWLQDGRWIETALRHRMLLSSGEYAFSEDLLQFVPCLPSSIEEPSPSTHARDAPRSFGKLQGFLANCLAGLRFCDERLRRASNSARSFLRRLADVPQHNSPLSCSGAYSSSNTNIFQQESVRPSSLDVFPQIEGRFFAFLDQAACKSAQCMTRCIQESQRRVVALLVRLQSADAACHGKSLLSLLAPFGGEGNQIVAYETIGLHDVYDFSVPAYGNYITAGIVHHNTLCAGVETAMHLTGLYPDWWQGKVFERATRGWVGGLTAEMTRDGAQRVLMGPIGQWGTGTIPKELIIEIKRSRGVPDAIETVLVRNIHDDGISQVTFKAFSDGREAFQSETLDWGWLDEEPPEDIYTEFVTRTNVSGGPIYLTFTPLLGMSNVVLRFWGVTHPDRHVTQMTIDDVGHYSEETKRKIVDQYPDHEREARTKGIPMLGDGRVFPIAEEVIREAPLAHIPQHWKQIIGLDLGWDHPTAAAQLILDPDTDTIHVHNCYRRAREIPLIHANAIMNWGSWIPVAWPRDGLQHDKGGSCQQLIHQYRDHGLNTLSEAAAFPDKRGFGVEAGIQDMLERMRTNRFKVNANLSQWWEEFRMYHRKNGEIIKERDDIMSATRYGVMMLRFAKPEQYAPKRPDRYASRLSWGGPTWMSN